MRKLQHPASDSLILTHVLYALSDPLRLSIVQKLAQTEGLTCGSFELPIAKSTASHHFRVLREAGVIHMRPEGTQYINSLRRTELDQRFPGLLDAILNAPIQL
ncbi:MAG: helix-turn-helix domain-containing protein [Thiofilum sp.]|uniref:ArsR/SmtB family transcription factor n=1 Tax=Thiofilum sp. TaxID=2212733 RepID=UPI0025F1C83B|nr:helix-turn-helix domain-containing protein [Thiofilum sp.]MBK8454045.1 helix-turn-helix transcriptional regulator [Thiofilum sp.]